MTPTFERAVGGMADIPQWFVWRLEWDGNAGKYQKRPARLDGTSLAKDEAKQFLDYDAIEFNVRALNNGGDPALRFAMGFWMTADCGYWFLDIDKCVHDDGTLLPFAAQLVSAFPGAMVEWSSSRKGLHIIGRGDPPESHRNKPPREIASQLVPLQLEFYTQDRGIAFGLDGEAQGCADTPLDVTQLCARYFPPREVSDVSRRPEWRGPADDDVLIDRMLNARQSAAAAFGGKTSLLQLWRGDAPKDSESDMALASHLAFWTGCDEERIARMMMRSGLVRDKWSEYRPGGTYLTYTIANACASCSNVYVEPERNLTVQNEMYGAPITVTHADAPSERISAAMFARQAELLDMISGCGDEPEMHNVVMPAIQEAGIPGALQERIVNDVKLKLNFWGNKMPIGRLRALLFPAAVRTGTDGALPEWAQQYCFVVNGDRFFNLHNGQYMTMVGFHAVYGRFMPVNESGRRENAAERCLHFWGMPIVEQVGYRPDEGSFYNWQGVSYANLYSPTSLPAVTPYTPEGIAGIEAFQAMLFDMCGRRQEVFLQLLYWYAHNVQHPGKKIRWAPIIKGVHGDGKTLAVTVLRAAMGYRNVTLTGNATLTNSGGFTDWAASGAVNVIEEIMLTGKQRHQLYNAMKEFISNDVASINPKGGKHYQTHNATNHYANTNHNDAVPMEPTDRRWFVIFTPWSSLEGMYLYRGLAGSEGARQSTDAIDYAWRNCAGELRAWFLGVAIPPTFDINGSAMMTPEKKRMMASSADDAEGAIQSILTSGGIGIAKNVFSSSHLSRTLHIRSQTDGFELPRGIALNHMLTRLGYSKLEKQVKWNGQTHTIWLDNGVELSNEDIRFALDQTQTQLKPI